MKRSFAEQDSMRQAGDREQQMKDLQKNLDAMKRLDCAICSADIDQYFASCASITRMKREMQVQSPYTPPMAMPSLIFSTGLAAGSC